MQWKCRDQRSNCANLFSSQYFDIDLAHSCLLPLFLRSHSRFLKTLSCCLILKINSLPCNVAMRGYCGVREHCCKIFLFDFDLFRCFMLPSLYAALTHLRHAPLDISCVQADRALLLNEIPVKTATREEKLKLHMCGVCGHAA